MPTRSVEAYDLYLRGRHLWSRRTEDSLRKAIGYLERARALDPRMALAEAALADVYITMGIYGTQAPREVMPLAAEAARRALLVEPELAEPWVSLATVRSLYEWSWPSAESDFMSAIAADVTFCAGVVTFATPADDPAKLLQAADRLMYEAKSTGRGQTRFATR